MNIELVIALFGVAFGAVGFWVTTFWMQPILRYHAVRNKILSDLVFFAQVTNTQGLNGQMQVLYEKRVVSNRRSSADLTVCLLELPFWYQLWLGIKGCDPEEAAKNLIGLSNTNEFEAAANRIERIKAGLCIKTTVV